jgi:hypothetical protein
LLQAAFRQHFRCQLTVRDWQVDPTVWRKPWGVHIQPAGSGAHAIRYLGAYVARSVISDQRIVSCSGDAVTFLWKDRSDHRHKPMTVSGSEFVKRYLRHVLPRGLCAIRYYGFLHPAAVRNRSRIALFSGSRILFGPRPKAPPAPPPNCPSCQKPMAFLARLRRVSPGRDPPDDFDNLHL